MNTVALLSAAHIHTPNFIKRMNDRSDVSVKYVWDDNPERGQAAANKLGAKLTGLEEIYADAEVKAVIICSETCKHEELVLPAIAAKKHLFIEKPLGYASADAYRMAKAINDAGLIFQTGFFSRSTPYHRFLKAQIELGHFGKITRIRHSNCHQGSLAGWFDGEWRWIADPKIAGVGAFGDLGAHSLDILLWFMGDVDSVSASIQTVTHRYEGCDESGEGILKFKNGAVGTLAAAWVDTVHPFRLQISGTEGHALVLGDDVYFQSQHVEGSDIKKVWTALPEALPHAFELFFDALNGKDVPLVSASEAAYGNAVMEALYRASSETRWVKPEDLAASN